MKEPNLPSLSESCPPPQFGQARGSEPSARAGKMWGASTSFNDSITWVVRNYLVPPTAAEKSRQKSRRTSFQSISWLKTRSSFSSSPAVKSYST